MHILLVHQIFVTPEEGGGTRHYELAKYLSGKGHRVTVIASDIDYLTGKRKHKRAESRDGMDIVYARTMQAVHRSFLHRALSFISFSASSFLQAMRIDDVDIVWGTSPPLFQSLSALLIARLKGKPFVFEVRDLWVDFARQLGVVRSGFILGLLKRLEGVLYRAADKIIVNSPGFIPFIGRYVPDQKLCLVPNGVISSEFDLQGDGQHPLRQAHDLGDKFIAIYIGNLGVANDIETILQAAETLRSEREIMIVLMGGGMMKEHFREIIREKGLANVLLVDAVPKALIPAVLADADIGIASLRDIPMFRTTYPNKVFDYMAAEKPTVLAIDGVIRDVIEQSNGGTFVAPGSSTDLANAIAKYFRDPRLRKEHGREARSYVRKHFEREKIADSLERILGAVHSRAGR